MEWCEVRGGVSDNDVVGDRYKWRMFDVGRSDKKTLRAGMFETFIDTRLARTGLTTERPVSTTELQGM